MKRFRETGETASFAGLVDAMPVILARQGRRCNAKVAPELASSGTARPSTGMTTV